MYVDTDKHNISALLLTNIHIVSQNITTLFRCPGPYMEIFLRNNALTAVIPLLGAKTLAFIYSICECVKDPCFPKELGAVVFVTFNPSAPRAISYLVSMCLLCLTQVHREPSDILFQCVCLDMSMDVLVRTCPCVHTYAGALQNTTLP